MQEVVFSPDGNMLATSDILNPIALHRNFEEGGTVITTYLNSTIGSLTEYVKAFSPDGTQLVRTTESTVQLLDFKPLKKG